MKTYTFHPDSIRSLFDNIAPTYDFLNHLLSLRRDLYWRKMAVQELKGIEGWILDIATGTGDVAIEIIHRNGHHRKVFGLDFSKPMIKRAQRKISEKGMSQTIALSLGDALSLPFRDHTFGASMIAFGLRNIVKKEQALSEMARVIKKNGKVIVLEFTFPQKGLMRRLYPIYFQRVLPWIGGVISGNRGAYAYLPESVLHFTPYNPESPGLHTGEEGNFKPKDEEKPRPLGRRYTGFTSAKHYEEIMRKVGLENVNSQSLTGGVASVISGVKKC